MKKRWIGKLSEGGPGYLYTEKRGNETREMFVSMAFYEDTPDIDAIVQKCLDNAFRRPAQNEQNQER